MNLETRMTQGLEANQQLNLAPQLLQWLRLLQLPTTELRTLVQQELDVNPTLEVADREAAPDELVAAEPTPAAEPLDPQPTSFEDRDVDARFELLGEMDADWRNDNGPAVKTSAADADEKYHYMLDSITAEESLATHLLAQANAAGLDEAVRKRVEVLIGSLDARGYLTASLDEMAGLAGCSGAALEQALTVVQAFDPPGVGARDLRECLLLQLEDKTSLAAMLVRDYLDALGRRQYREIAAALKVEEGDVREALESVRTLNPEPGRAVSREKIRYITPDVVIRRVETDYQVEMNDARVPRLRISDSSRELLESGKLASEDAAYLRKKIRTSSFLIQGIKQRQETLRKVAQEILRNQQEFFSTDAGELKPLTMAHVAKAINVHETTVSRAVANKYVETPQGLFELKHFFRTGYRCDDGSAVVPSAVKDMIAALVESENPVEPLTDLQIVARMKNQGVRLARRTVAKYREELGLASSKERITVGIGKPPIRLAVQQEHVAPRLRVYA